jgi:hypothetical protein
MANRRHIPPEPPRPELPGGARRKSVRVDLTPHPWVARRQALNTALLSGTCGHGPVEHAHVEAGDAALLQLVAGERFGGEQTLLRHRALHELGQVRTFAAMETLARLSASPLEDASARGAALAAMAQASPLLGRALAATLQGDAEMAVHVGKLSGTPVRRKPGKRRTPSIDRE